MRTPIARPLLFCSLLITAATHSSAAVTNSQPSKATAVNAASTPRPSPTAAGFDANQPAPSQPVLVAREIPEIHARISLPKEWSLLPGKLLEGDVLLATREKITNENDPWSTGLSMTVDRNGARDSGQKASDYARALAMEAREKAGEEASPLKESQSGPFHEIRFDFPVASEPPLLITEMLRANDTTGTLAVIIWQMPKEESQQLQGLRDVILSGLLLNPTQ